MQTWSAGYYEQIVQYLHDAGIYVGAVNPKLIKDYGSRNTLHHVKTDKADAMFQNNGIFRDVLLRVSEPADLWDIDTKTVKDGDTYSLTLKAQTLSDTDVTFTLEGHGISKTAKVSTKDKTAEATFSDLKVTEWTAEDPVLYNIYFETSTSCVKEKLGFRTVTIDGDVFLVNGKKIKFKGVNHHDTSPTNSYTMAPDEIEKDVLLCKEFNIDMIRTSH